MIAGLVACYYHLGPMLVTDTCLVNPNERWLIEHTSLGRWQRVGRSEDEPQLFQRTARWKGLLFAIDATYESSRYADGTSVEHLVSMKISKNHFRVMLGMILGATCIASIFIVDWRRKGQKKSNQS